MRIQHLRQNTGREDTTAAPQTGVLQILYAPGLVGALLRSAAGMFACSRPANMKYLQHTCTGAIDYQLVWVTHKSALSQLSVLSSALLTKDSGFAI